MSRRRARRVPCSGDFRRRRPPRHDVESVVALLVLALQQRRDLLDERAVHLDLVLDQRPQVLELRVLLEEFEQQEDGVDALLGRRRRREGVEIAGGAHAVHLGQVAPLQVLFQIARRGLDHFRGVLYERA